MRPIIRTLAVALALSALGAGPGSAQGAAEPGGAPQVTTVASYEHGTFLENLSVGPDGRLLVTSYLDRAILSWDGGGEPARFAELDAHPVGILSRSDDIVLSAHGRSFLEGPDFTRTNAFLILDRDGAVARRVEAPEALFLNGLVEIGPDTVLAADSLAGRIWRLDPSTGSIGTWLADPLLGPDPAAGDARPGANGLKVRDGWLYVSNSSRGTIHRLRLAGTEPDGALEVVATPGAVDDFTFLSDGSIAAATHGGRLIRIDLGGAVSDILSEGCDGCTSVATFGPDASLVVLTTGNLLEGGSEPARVLSVASPVGR